MHVRCSLFALGTLLWLAGGPAGALAQTIQEREPNDHLSSPQVLSVTGGTLRVEAAMGEVNAALPVDDLDFYQVFLRAGDVVTIAVENGLGGAEAVHLYLAVFEPAPNSAGLRTAAEPSYEVVRVADTTSGGDPRIESYVAPRTGQYVIGVTSYPRYFDAAGILLYALWYTNGDYDLVISQVDSEILPVPIAIKPGSTDVAPFNPKARGRLPVAILSTPDFSPLDVDLGSLRFGKNGNEESLLSCQGDKGRDGPKGTDLNGDGIPDLVCHFDRPLCGFTLGDLEGTLTGSTTAGVAFQGSGSLKIVPPGR